MIDDYEMDELGFSLVDRDSETHNKYTELMDSPHFLLTMQPKMIEGNDSDETDALEDFDSGFMADSFRASSLRSGLGPDDDDDVDGENIAGNNSKRVLSAQQQERMDATSVRRYTEKQIKKLNGEEESLLDAMKYRSYIISSRGNFKEYWDYVVMTIAIYNCIWTPLTISYDWADMQERENSVLKVIDYCTIVIYSIDILIQFFTSYQMVATGDFITKPSWIAKRYIFSVEFLLDLLSTIPFRYV